MSHLFSALTDSDVHTGPFRGFSLFRGCLYIDMKKRMSSQELIRLERSRNASVRRLHRT
jgi:hypothetical protein